MALTSTDETDLIMPLYEGVHEEPRFATFLARLRRRTQADYICLTMGRSDTPYSNTTEFFSGRNLRNEARELGLPDVFLTDHIAPESLRPGRVYSLAEFVDHDPAYKAHRVANSEGLSITDERVVRIPDVDGVGAWLVMASGKPCTAADSALLSSLAPYVSIALRNLLLLEGQRIEAAMSAEGLSRAGTGWIVFDSEARVAGVDQATQQRIGQLTGCAPRIGERLRDFGVQAERALISAAADFATNPRAPQRPVVLSESPRLEALLVSAEAAPAAVMSLPVMLALCRFPTEHSPERAARLARLFDLPRREAELAIALCDGLSIAEAAEAMGLTLETARNYSKRLYAKLGVRGQAELVRLVYESSAVLG